MRWVLGLVAYFVVGVGLSLALAWKNGRDGNDCDALYRYLTVNGGDEDTSAYVLVGMNGHVVPISAKVAELLKKRAG